MTFPVIYGSSTNTMPMGNLTNHPFIVTKYPVNYSLLPMTVARIAWIAGLMEGEGWFMGVEDKRSTRGIGANWYPVAGILMTDKDILQRLASIVGGRVLGPYQPKESRYIQKGPRKPVFTFRINGRRAIGLMLTIYTFMGERRQAKIREIVEFYRQIQPKLPWWNTRHDAFGRWKALAQR